MALREMFIRVGFQVDPSGLSEADARANTFRDNLLAADTHGQQLGSTIAATGAAAVASMGDASEAAAGLAGWWETNKTRVEDLGNQLIEYRGIIAGIAGVTGGLVGFSIKTAAEFEAAMSKVAAVSRASEEDLALLTAQARELGTTTPFSASQAAEAMTYLAMAGFDTQQTIAAMPGLLDTAAAAGESLGRTADIVSNILSGFNLEAEQTGRVADVLTATFTSSNTTLGTLGETMKLVAPIAATLGVQIEEVAALTAVLGDAGIQGSMAGTSLRTILTSLAAPTGAAAKAISDLGIQTTDAAGNMLPITSILDQIATATAHMGDAQRAAVLEMLAGREGVSALSALMSVGASRIDEYADSLRNSAGIAAEVAARQMDNLQGAMTELRSAIEGAQISIGNAFIPVLRVGARALTSIVNVFNSLPGPVQTAIAVGLGAVAMVSSLALAASFLIPQIGTAIKMFGAFRTALMATRVGAMLTGVAVNASLWPIVLAIGAVVAAGLILQDVWMYLRGEGDTLTARIIEWVGTWTSQFGGIVDWFRELPARTMGALANWWDGIKSWFAETFDFGGLLSSAFESALNLIPAPLRGIAEKIMGFFPQSPAKEGPLTQLDQVGQGMVEELSRGMSDAEFPGAAYSGAAVGVGGGMSVNVTVNVDARGATSEDAESIGQMTADKIREVLEELFAAEYHSVAMAEV